MNMSELVEKVAEESKITDFRAMIVMRCLVDIIKESLNRGEEVKIQGIGTFEIVKQKNMKKYDSINDRPMIIKNNKRIKFSPSRKWKDEINEGREVVYLKEKR